MPKVTAQGSPFGPVRSDLARHDLAGASAWVLAIISLYYKGSGEVDQTALVAGQAKAVEMVQRAASLELAQRCGTVQTRVINETGHKLPTGHIEGRRVWVNVRCYDASENLLKEYGHYDPLTAELDEETTDIYEMHVGLSDYASFVTGYPPGVTTHMALADVIEKDTRIPPRGFDNAIYASAGAPAVDADYADGQYWDDTEFWLPDETAIVISTVYYQTVTKHYIEALRDGNHSDHWGETLYQLWLETDKGAPIEIVSQESVMMPFLRGDANENELLDLQDFEQMYDCIAGPEVKIQAGCGCFDFNGDHRVDLRDFQNFEAVVGGLP